MGVLVAVTVPSLTRVRSSIVLRAAAQEAASVLHFARGRAMARDVNTGVKFTQNNGIWFYTIYDDIDGDGLRNDDIAAGIDLRVQGPDTVLAGDRNVRIGFAEPRPNDPDTGDPFAPTANAVQFGLARIASFSRRGEGTSGSLYITDGTGGAAAVRVHGATGRVRIIHYDAETGRWK